MHDEPEWSLRTELGLLAACAGLAVLFALGCWIGANVGATLNDALRVLPLWATAAGLVALPALMLAAAVLTWRTGSGHPSLVLMLALIFIAVVLRWTLLS